MRLTSIRYELNPKPSKKKKLGLYAGTCRQVYNYMLARKIAVYEKDKTSLSPYELMKELTILKATDENFKHWNNVPSQALQQKILDLGKAYQNFFNNNAGYPKFKRKKDHNDSFRLPVSCNIDYSKWKVYIPKIGWVEIFKGHNKQIEGKIHQYTITHTATDRYFLAIQYEAPDREKTNNGKE